MKIPVAILVRVSTKRQETDRQLHELREAASSRGWEVLEEIEEHGIIGFYARYLWFTLRYGYRNNPLEVQARKAEDK